MDSESYNLSAMEHDLIAEAYRKYPRASDEVIASKLGISVFDLREKKEHSVCGGLNLEALERRLIDEAFCRHGRESIKAVASSLGLSSRQLYRKLNAVGMSYKITNNDINSEYNLAALEERLMTIAIEKNPDKNIEHIATVILGIAEKTFYQKMCVYGLKRIRERSVSNYESGKGSTWRVI